MLSTHNYRNLLEKLFNIKAMNDNYSQEASPEEAKNQCSGPEDIMDWFTSGEISDTIQPDLFWLEMHPKD